MKITDRLTRTYSKAFFQTIFYSCLLNFFRFFFKILLGKHFQFFKLLLTMFLPTDCSCLELFGLIANALLPPFYSFIRIFFTIFPMHCSTLPPLNKIFRISPISSISHIIHFFPPYDIISILSHPFLILFFHLFH